MARGEGGWKGKIETQKKRQGGPSNAGAGARGVVEELEAPALVRCSVLRRFSESWEIKVDG